jgi:LytS/YehU family sensor histidine kinase
LKYTYLKITLLFLCIAFTINAQEKNTDKYFSILVTKAIAKKSTSYKNIDSTFYKYKKDTIKMKQLALKSNEASYLEGESYALNMLGTFYRDRAMYQQAIITHKKAQELANKAENLDLKVISLNLLGVVCRRMDKVRSALDYHTKALKLTNQEKKPSIDLKRSIAVSQNSIGNIYLALEQYDLAIKQFNKSLVHEKEINNKLGLAINYHNIGYAKEGKGFLKEALTDYKTSLDYNQSINSLIGEVICYNSIGQIYIKQNKLSVAKIMINQALKKALKTQDQYYIAQSYIKLGWIQYELNETENAEKNINKGLQIAQKLDLKSSLLEAHKHLSILNERKQNFKAAINHFKEYKNTEESINNNRNLQYVNDIVLKYDSESKTNKIIALSNENELVKLKLEQSKKTVLANFVGLILLGIIFLFLYRHRRLKQEKQILLLEQDMLRSQMNPHFIFNSLNSIKLYIINNEKENAVYYLNKFSKLIRKILIATTEKEMSLTDELETMQLYMNIENIRFSNEIDYQVEIDKNINTDNILVPSLILQPFLENSLWHGLSTKKENKEIILNVNKTSSNYITITITDNGVGRVTSQHFKNQKTLKRKSVGIELTKERLANFSKRFSNSYSLEITDLYDGKKPIGTQIVINIPINEMHLKTA